MLKEEKQLSPTTMQGIIHFETFLLTGILLNLTPGNDTIFILTKSIGQGKKAGIISTLGISTGSVIHTLLAAFGLSIIIAKSIILFNVIKYVGAVYLLYMGYQMLTDKSQLATSQTKETKQIVNYWKIYRDGILTNVLNPKVALFFIAFLPQFIDSSKQDSVLPFLALGTTFITTATIWSFILVSFSAAFFAKLNQNPRFSSYLHKLCGTALIGLGIKVAFSERR